MISAKYFACNRLLAMRAVFCMYMCSWQLQILLWQKKLITKHNLTKSSTSLRRARVKSKRFCSMRVVRHARRMCLNILHPVLPLRCIIIIRIFFHRKNTIGGFQNWKTFCHDFRLRLKIACSLCKRTMSRTNLKMQYVSQKILHLPMKPNEESDAADATNCAWHTHTSMPPPTTLIGLQQRSQSAHLKTRKKLIKLAKRWSGQQGNKLFERHASVLNREATCCAPFHDFLRATLKNETALSAAWSWAANTDYIGRITAGVNIQCIILHERKHEKNYTIFLCGMELGSAFLFLRCRRIFIKWAV